MDNEGGGPAVGDTDSAGAIAGGGGGMNLSQFFTPAPNAATGHPDEDDSHNTMTMMHQQATPYSGIVQKYIHDETRRKESDYQGRMHRVPVFDTVDADHAFHHRQQKREESSKESLQRIIRLLLVVISALSSKVIYKDFISPRIKIVKEGARDPTQVIQPDFVYEHPYITSSYYAATSNRRVLNKMKEMQVDPKRGRLPDRERGIESRLAILRPFCEFDAEPLPTTFTCWNSLVPCRAAEMDLGSDDEDGGEMDEWVLFDNSLNGTGRKLHKDEEDEWECEVDYTENSASSWFNAAKSLFKRCKRRRNTRNYFDDVPADALRTSSVDLFLFYSQTLSENEVAMKAVDKIMEEFFSPGGWSRCFDNIYAVESNIPKELDLYIPAAQEEFYNWVNGPNRQYEAGFRIIQSGEWGDYDGFYLMEGDSVPVKSYWLDVILGEIKAHKPFAVLGA